MKKIKKIITILIISILVIFIKSTTYATDDWLTNLTGQGQESISVWSSNLGTCSIYVYGTKNGGEVKLVEGSSESFSIINDIRQYKATANDGWKFIKWGTYFESSGLDGLGKGQNSTYISVGDKYLFSKPNDKETPFVATESTIQLNYAAITQIEYRIYAVFQPIVTVKVDEHGTLRGGGESGVSEISLPVSYGEDSSQIFIDNKDIGYEINTINYDSVKDIEIEDSERGKYVYIFEEVTRPHTLNVTFRPVVYKISFDGNTSTSGNMDIQTFSYGTSQNLTTNTFEKSGYVFNGWNTKPDGTGTNYSDGQEVSNLTTESGQTFTLYAQWTLVDSNEKEDDEGENPKNEEENKNNNESNDKNEVIDTEDNNGDGITNIEEDNNEDEITNIEKDNNEDEITNIEEDNNEENEITNAEEDNDEFNTENEKGNTDIPVTSDNIMRYFMLFAISSIGITVISLKGIRKNRKTF